MSSDDDLRNFRGRLPPKVWDANELQVFNDPKMHSLEIRSMSVGLTQEEVLLYYNLEIGDLPPYDRFFFETEFNRGRLIAVQNAANHLMQSMPNDKDAALAYLTRFGEGKWTNSSKSSGSEGIIKVVLQD